MENLELKRTSLKDRTGERYLTNQGYWITIIEYFNKRNCTVEFVNGVVLKNKQFKSILAGEIRNPMHHSVCNIGYFGVGNFKSKVNKVTTKHYDAWNSMINRCYNTYYNKRNPTYVDVKVCNEWHNFQNFAKWFEENYKSEFMGEWCLDKDILVKGNKIYSSETCCLVPQEINKLFTKRERKRGNLPIGVTKSGKKFISTMTAIEKLNSGTFNTPEETFNAYKIAKESWIKEVADKWKDQIGEKVYQAMYDYKVEITD